MFLSQLKLWNFKKFGGGGDPISSNNQIREPDLDVVFKNGLNVLIGENDSGKTSIIDAIKLVLKTHSTEWIKVYIEDFYKNTKHLRIECIFRKLSNFEASHFTEWLGMAKEDGQDEPYLKLILEIQHNGERILPFEVRAGTDDKGNPLSAEAKDYLKTTYLRPLRDAQNELVPKRNSRLSQILEGHEVFKGKAAKHKLTDVARCFNCLVQKYFDADYFSPNCDESNNKCPFVNKFFNKDIGSDGKDIMTGLNKYIQSFLSDDKMKAKFDISTPKLKNVLEILKLSFDEEFSPGLGSQNLLFIASELLNLDRNNWTGLRLGLIEEIEAHLHPQAQLRVIEYFQTFISEQRVKSKTIQLILTTHSPNLGSKIDLENLLICSDGNVFPMDHDFTDLRKEDYRFLQRFLDVTKSNLFFAAGVILVEGFSEEILLPVLANKIGYNLVKKGVSIVNVAGVAFLRYSKIFIRKDNKRFKIPVSVVTDLDLEPGEENKKNDLIAQKRRKYESQKVKVFVSPHWTLEYCLASSETLKKLFYKAVLLAFKEQKNYTKKEQIEKIDKIISEIDSQNYKPLSAKVIYNQILGEEPIKSEGEIEILPKTKISKSIIAQYFADLLNQESIDKKLLVEDENIKYLIDAIKYASGENIDNSGNR